ncbi:MAG: hypothetical protein MPK62_00395 [Alphaproteobacteria bacterium]|nr:hypothetical protein [Alphaproteobacteria bacterium]MDA8029597.1 hypothetical protein [Alphaproteobacteria bacterium]
MGRDDTFAGSDPGTGSKKLIDEPRVGPYVGPESKEYGSKPPYEPPTPPGSIPNDLFSSKHPSRWWFLGHLFFGIISGLTCWLVWKDTNRQAANRHLIWGLVFSIVSMGAWTSLGAIGAVLSSR